MFLSVLLMWSGHLCSFRFPFPKTKHTRSAIVNICSRAVYGRLLLFPLAELAELWAVTYESLFWQLGLCLMCYRRQPPAVPTQQPHWDTHAHLRERQQDLLKVSLRRLHKDSHLRQWKTIKTDSGLSKTHLQMVFLQYAVMLQRFVPVLYICWCLQWEFHSVL